MSTLQPTYSKNKPQSKFFIYLSFVNSLFTLRFFTPGGYFPHNRLLVIDWHRGNPVKWPEGVPYLVWQNFCQKVFARCKGSGKKSPSRSKHNRKGISKFKKSIKSICDTSSGKGISTIFEEQFQPIDQYHLSKLKLIDSIAQVENALPKQLPESIKQADVKLELTTLLRKFLTAKHISRHIEKNIPESRKPETITYSKESLIMSALVIFLMRMESGNNYDESRHNQLHKYSKDNIAKFIGAPEGCAPIIKTVEDFLKTLNEDCINNLMIDFFRDLQKSKFFKDHSHLLPGDLFHVAFDCVHTHTYKHPHHADSEESNDCPYCLKRVYNKGTEKEKTRWVHNTLVASFVFLGHLKIPIYNAPLHAQQLTQWENASDFIYKQECELVALKRILPIFRDQFPRMKIVILLDGLYANRPAIRIIEKYKFGYAIVRKEDSFPLIAKACNERAATFGHAKNFIKRTVDTYEEWEIERKYEWFNTIDIGDENGNLTTNVLRLVEIRKKDGEKNQVYKCEWLCSQRLSAKSCEVAARNARLRWEIEDLFNAMKMRGFNLRHDYSRHPKSCCVWQSLGFFAFSIFELFRFSSPVEQLCKGLCQTTIANALQRQLFAAPTNELFPEGYESKKIQFRYNFVIEFECSIAISYNDPLRVPKNGSKRAKVPKVPKAIKAA